MKKTRVLGVALTLAATMAVGGAMGQDVKGGNDYVKTGATDGAAQNKKTFITEGKKAGLYAMPDANFHPGYVNPGYVLTPNFTWSWTAAGVTATTGTGVYANFVELSAAAGAYDVVVKEKASAAFGGCEDATGKTIRFVVFAKPTIAFDATTDRKMSTATCGDLAKGSHTVKFNINATDNVNVSFKLEEFKVSINSTTGDPEVAAAPTQTYDIVTGKLSAGAATATTVSATDFKLGGTAFLFDTDEVNRDLVLTVDRAYAVNTADVVTLYRYTIDNTGATPSHGVNDFVSRKSDHDTKTATAPAAYTWYGDGKKTTLDVYVKKAPKTGPIYHIKNNIAV